MSYHKGLYPTLVIALICSVCFSILYAIAEEEGATAPEKTTALSDHVEYATAQMRLTRALLQQAVEKNESIPGLIASGEIERLRMNASLSKDLLAKAQLGKKDLSDDFFLLFCQDQLSSAKSRLAKAVEIRKAVPASMSEVDIEVLAARLKLAELELSRGKSAIEESSTSEINWKLNILLKEVLRLSRESVQSEPR